MTPKPVSSAVLWNAEASVQSEEETWNRCLIQKAWIVYCSGGQAVQVPAYPFNPEREEKLTIGMNEALAIFQARGIDPATNPYL